MPSSTAPRSTTLTANLFALLTAKQFAFVEHYNANGGNATKAAIAAGYSERNAEQQGYKLLQMPAIQAAIAARRVEVRQEVAATRDRVTQELARIAFADIRQLYTDAGGLLLPKDWPDAIAACVTQLDVTEIKDSEGVPYGEVKKLKLADKLSALDKLCRILGMYEADNSQQGGAVAESLRALIEAAHGTAFRPGQSVE